jgi:hypothetical protein
LREGIISPGEHNSKINQLSKIKSRLKGGGVLSFPSVSLWVHSKLRIKSRATSFADASKGKQDALKETRNFRVDGEGREESKK